MMSAAPYAIGFIVLATIACVAFAGRSRGRPERFRGWVQYRPSCSGEWLSERRGACKGLTTGDMPSIEDDGVVSWAPCAGALGVPPPVYQ